MFKNVSSVFDYFRNLFYARIVVPIIYLKFSRKINVKSSIETIDYIIKHKVSISRYGDYEFMSIFNESNNFNKANVSLSQRLLEILQSDLPNHIICLPHAFTDLSNDNLRACIFWKHYIAKNWKRILNVTPLDKTYFDASFTRFYMDSKDKTKERIQTYVNKMRMIWDGRDIIIVEGSNSRLGIGNDFLNNANSVGRILCPPTDAFLKYDEILLTTKKYADKKKLILCALGATATILAYDLASEGYQALDIGHADIEYCWFKMGVMNKVVVEGKAVNEIGVNTASFCYDVVYQQQILSKIN